MNVAPEQLLGRVLGGRYRLDRVLGRGGMGVVFQATQLDLGRQVAVKVLLEMDAQATARLRQEALTAGSLSCPYVVSIFDFQAPPNEAPFVVMELLAGESLGSLLARERALDVGRACRIATEALVGLDAAHRAAVVHRDVKPSNLWLSSGRGMEGHVKVLDFGIAKPIDGSGVHTTTGSLLGTPAYLAPEQLRGMDATARSDVHAMGVVLFEMLTGSRPWQAPAAELLLEILQRVPPPVHTLAPHVPPRLSAVISRALEKNPADRFTSADEMRLHLAPFASPTAPTSSPSLPHPTVPSAPPTAAGSQPTQTFGYGVAAPAPTGPMPPPTTGRGLGPAGYGVPATMPLPAPSTATGPAPARSIVLPLLLGMAIVVILGLGGTVGYLAWASHHDSAPAGDAGPVATVAPTASVPSTIAPPPPPGPKTAPGPTSGKPTARPDAGGPSVDAGPGPSPSPSPGPGTKPSCSCISSMNSLICPHPMTPVCFCNGEGSSLCPTPHDATGHCATDSNYGAFKGAGLKTGNHCSGYVKGSTKLTQGTLTCNFCYGRPTEPAVPNAPCEGIMQGAETPTGHIDKTGLWICNP